MISSISILRWKASGLIKAKVPCKYIWPGIASTISVNQQVIKVYSELGSNVSLHNIKALVYNLLGPQVHPIYCIGWQISVQHYYKERKEWIPAGGAWCPVCHTTAGAPVPDKKTHRPTSVWASILPTSTSHLAAGPSTTAWCKILLLDVSGAGSWCRQWLCQCWQLVSGSQPPPTLGRSIQLKPQVGGEGRLLEARVEAQA